MGWVGEEYTNVLKITTPKESSIVGPKRITTNENPKSKKEEAKELKENIRSQMTYKSKITGESVLQKKSPDPMSRQ